MSCKTRFLRSSSFCKKSHANSSYGTFKRLLLSKQKFNFLYQWHVRWLSFDGDDQNTTRDLATPVRRSNRFREVTGSNPVEVMTFSGFCS